MSGISYTEPRAIVPIFNPYDYRNGETTLTINTGDDRYQKLKDTSITLDGITMEGGSSTSSNTSHLISISELDTNYKQLELTVFANDSAGYIGMYKVIVSKLATYPQVTASTKVSNFTTFDITNNANTDNSIKVTLDPTAEIKWYYISY